MNCLHQASVKSEKVWLSFNSLARWLLITIIMLDARDKLEPTSPFVCLKEHPAAWTDLLTTFAMESVE